MANHTTIRILLVDDDQASRETLAEWIERVVADADLAAATRAATKGADSYVNACIAAHALVGARLQQARAVLGLPAAGANDRAETAS